MTASVAPLPPKPKGRVLPTMNEDGTRRWVRPKPSEGKWATRRKIVAYALMAIYLAIPHLWMNGKPLMLLDAPRREFTSGRPGRSARPRSAHRSTNPIAHKIRGS